MILTLLLFWFSSFREPIISDGYVSHLSVYPGDSLTIFLNAYKKQDDYSVRIYNLKGNAVAKYVATVFPQDRNSQEPWKNGFGYKPTFKIKVPNLKSGVYLIDDQIPLIIKARHPKIIIVYSSNTENAYCNAGGKSLYSYNSSNRKAATVVSFLRPINLPKHSEAFLRWFYKLGIADVGYVIDHDLDDYKTIANSKLLMIVGHSEYWSLQARKNFDHFVNEGNDALVLSGNTMWWQVRYEHNGTQLVCYKSESSDPEISLHLKTINWDNPVLNYSIISSIGADFPRAGFGQKTDRGWDGYKIINPKSPLLKDIRARKGKIISLPTDEADGTPLSNSSSTNLPQPDYKVLGFNKIEIVGYDSTFREKDGIATWIVFKKNEKSGIVINTASTDWCSQRGMNIPEIKKITLTMISLLLKKENVFSE